MRITKTIMLLAVLLLSVSAWSGDLTTDNLTVTKDATIMGNMYFSSTAGGTNGGGTATGGTITTNGNYRIHTFANVGAANFVVSGGTLNCDVLVVAGGGGGDSGGGGAGGFIKNYSKSVTGTVTVTVGAGGLSVGESQNNHGYNGGNSVFSDLTAIGGGGGGGVSPNLPAGAAQNGGSGGGGGASGDRQTYGGNGTTGQGNAGGGNAGYMGGIVPGGGGGGAGAVGGDAVSDYQAGDGGIGLMCDFSGSNVYYAGGGGGCAYNYGVGGAGGLGGGGAGLAFLTRGENGVINTGGGGGGGHAWPEPLQGGTGGSGIVIVRYPFTSSSNVTTLSISSNGISQTSASGVNVLMSKVGIGTDNPAEQLHVVGNVRVDGTNIVSAITLVAPAGDIPMGVYTDQ